MKTISAFLNEWISQAYQAVGNGAVAGLTFGTFLAVGIQFLKVIF